MDLLNKMKARFSAWCGNVIAVYEEKQFQRDLATLMPLAEKRFASHPHKQSALYMAKQSFDYLRFPVGPKTNFEQISLYFSLSLNIIEDILQLQRFVGIQPMGGPVGLSYVMEYKVSDELTAPLKLEVVSKPTVAVSRKYDTSFPIEVMQDMTASMNRESGRDEVIGAVRQELADEWFGMVLKQLLDATSSNIDVDLPLTNLTEKDGNALEWAIMRASNEIATNSKRGAGNYAILSPLEVSVLANHSSQYQAVEQSPIPNRIQLVGVLNEKVKIYQHDFTPERLSTIIVGYKGVGETDAGYVLSPYIVMLPQGTRMDMSTFQPKMVFANRHGSSSYDGFTNGSYYCTVTPNYS